jgi:hypothetical protein
MIGIEIDRRPALLFSFEAGERKGKERKGKVFMRDGGR